MPPKSRSGTPAKPSVASRGAFDARGWPQCSSQSVRSDPDGCFKPFAVAVEGGDGSDSDQGASAPSSPRGPPSSSNISASTKKGRAKQRARDRARKQATSGAGQDAPDEPVETGSVGDALAAEMQRREEAEKGKPKAGVNGHSDSNGGAISPASTSTATFGATPEHQEVPSAHAPKSVEFAGTPSELQPSANISGRGAPTLSRTGTADSHIITSVSATTSASATPFTSDIDDDDDETTDADFTGTDFERDVRFREQRSGAERFSTPTLGGLAGGRFASSQSPTGTVRASSPPLPPKSPDSSTRGAGRVKAPKQEDHGADHDPAKKRKSVITRIIWSLVMVFAFIGVSFLPFRGSCGLLTHTPKAS